MPKINMVVSEENKAKLAKDARKAGCDTITAYVHKLAGLKPIKPGRPAKKAAKS